MRNCVREGELRVGGVCGCARARSPRSPRREKRLVPPPAVRLVRLRPARASLALLVGRKAAALVGACVVGQGAKVNTSLRDEGGPRAAHQHVYPGISIKALGERGKDTWC